MITINSKLYKYGRFHSYSDIEFENVQELRDYIKNLEERENCETMKAELFGEAPSNKWRVEFSYEGKDYSLMEDL